MNQLLLSSAFLLTIASLLTVNAFLNPFQRSPLTRGNFKVDNLQMVQVDVIGKHMEVTPAIRNHLNDKLDPIFSKLGRNVNSAHVVLHCEKYNGDQAQIVEVTAQMKGGSAVRAVVDDDNDMYAAIDKVSHILSNNLKKHSKTHNTLNAKRRHQKVLKVTIDPEESMEEPEEILFDVEHMPEFSELTRGTKTLDRLDMFSKDSTTIEEATNRMQEEKHQFYAFRNKDTNEVNIVYLMKNGEVGLIQPSDETLLKYASTQEEVEGSAFSFEDKMFPKIAHHDSY